MAIGRTNAGGGSTFLPNLLDNSDFLHFVAQAGVGGNHGTQTYAGDRWILDSGTVTGAWNANGNGHSTITLNGTIRQIVAEPPTGQYACAVEMVSGTATIAYADGAVTITSSGGVLKNAGLYAGSRAPKYVPKGYGAELMECKRYYKDYIAWSAITTAYIDWEGKLQIYIPMDIPMRINPTCSRIKGSLIVGNQYIDINIANVTVAMHNNMLYIAGPTSFATYASRNCVIFLGDTPLTLSADL